MKFEFIVQDYDCWCIIVTRLMGIDELSNSLKYVIYAYMDFCFKIDTLALIIDAIF